MTFPASFPFVFEQGHGYGLPITGWFPDLFVAAPVAAGLATVPAPDVVYQHLVNVPAMAGAVTVPTPVVNWAVSAPVMTAPELIPNPIVVFTVPASPLAVAATIPAPTVQETLSVPSMLAAASVPAPAPMLAVSSPAAPVAASIPAPIIGESLSAPAITAAATVVPPGVGMAAEPAAMTTAATIPAPTVAQIGPAYDNSWRSTLQSALASGTPFTWPSQGGTAGAYGIVFVANESGSAMGLTATPSVTWGGIPMTSLGSAYNNNVLGDGWGWVFGLNGIPGGNQTISVTLTQSGKTFTGYGSSYSYTNVSSPGALQTAFGSSASPSVTVAAANAADIVWGAVLTNNFAQSAFSLTTRQSTSAPPEFSAGDTTGSTSVTVSATVPSTVWSAFGLDLR